jgi:hypothetical protein
LDFRPIGFDSEHELWRHIEKNHPPLMKCQIARYTVHLGTSMSNLLALDERSGDLGRPFLSVGSLLVKEPWLLYTGGDLWGQQKLRRSVANRVKTKIWLLSTGGDF